MTRCSGYTGNNSYEDYVHSLSDPTIKFHVDAGAKILKVVPKYRPEDTENEGRAVLIKYDLNSTHDEKMESTIIHSNDTSDIENMLTIVELYQICGNILNTNLESSLTISAFENKTFMNIGLDSLQLMELSATVQKRFPFMTVYNK